jgi:hypothetical protein
MTLPMDPVAPVRKICMDMMILFLMASTVGHRFATEYFQVRITAMHELHQPLVKSLTTRTGDRHQTLLEDVRLSRRSGLSAHHHSRASGQESLLLARHGRAPAAAPPLLRIKVAGSPKPLTRGKRSGDFLFRM